MVELNNGDRNYVEKRDDCILQALTLTEVTGMHFKHCISVLIGFNCSDYGSADKNSF